MRHSRTRALPRLTIRSIILAMTDSKDQNRDGREELKRLTVSVACAG